MSVERLRSVALGVALTLLPCQIVTWIIPPEVFTTELRAKANAVVQVIHYSISLVITVSP